MSASENATSKPSYHPVQFTLRQVGIAVLVLCVVLALFVQWGIWAVPGLIAIVIVVCVAHETYYGHSARAIALLALLLSLASSVLVSGPQREGDPPPQCRNKLKQIGIALHNYHDDYGCFPPPYIADASGKPMHSWRVLLLPYIEERSLYELYDFSEPWNGPNNRLLAGEIPAVYRCTDLPRGLTSESAFLAIVGPSTAWRTDQPTSLSDIKDGLGNTLMVVEVHESGVNWLEPRDWAAATMPLPASQLPQPKYQRHSHGRHAHESGNWGVFADGNVHLLPSDMPPAKLKSLTTIAGSD
jgi:hypothetical protein